MAPPDASHNPGRRELLRGLGGNRLAGRHSTGQPRPGSTVAHPARIVIVGSGLGGLAVANRLSRELMAPA